ncbi:putative RNA polymerase II transcriptional coactivator KIWI [Cocos nucifera]|uniref:Putative RNA polymerase II transcriptional coactivator KIWI n=1 Tax=Cocos nucifera TaxID=13894 RepID=A0A8K0IXL6_COCNU|nr:putative RNA polymerase II transcriptional coactivator KIWI [Cocos nucifera]
MWRKGKKRNDEESAGGGFDGAPPSKKLAMAESDEDGIVVCEISKNRRVSVRSWQGKVVVDIREFYVKDGKQLPGKKGLLSLLFSI